MKAAIIGALDIEHMGGGEGNAVMISNILADQGFKVKYFGSGRPIDNSEKHENLNYQFDYEPSAFTHDLMAHPFILRTSRLLSLGMVGLYRFKRTFNKVSGFDLYYFQNPTFLMRKLIPKFLSQGSKVIIANHGTYFEYLGNSKFRLLRILGKIATKFILDPVKPYKNSLVIHTQNSYQTDFYLQHGFPEDNILEIPQHNVNMKLYGVSPEKERFNVGFLGRLTESKGLDVLTEVIRRNHDMTFHIIGNGPLMDRLNNSIEQKNAIIYGFVSESKKRQILSECDALIIPSYFESLSIAAIEALASGLPIVCSETAPGLRYIISKNSEFGELIPRTADAFSECLKDLKRKKMTPSYPSLEERYSRRTKAIEIFDNKVLTLKLIEMVNKTIQASRSVQIIDDDIAVSA